MTNADLAHMAAIDRKREEADQHFGAIDKPMHEWGSKEIAQMNYSATGKAMAEDAANPSASQSSRKGDSLGRMAHVFIEMNAPQMKRERRDVRFAMAFAIAIAAVMLLALWGAR